jgi:potassium-transporting ATPase potassium-binding subunit
MASDLLQILLYLAIILAGTPVLGGYMARVLAGERTLLPPQLATLERAILGACGIDWSRHTLGPPATNVVGLVVPRALPRPHAET